MQIETEPLFFDWSFWTAVIALVALVLSQIPPIHVLLKRAKISLELYSKIHITHKLGNPNVQLHLMLSNIGGRKVRVRDIKVSISRDGQRILDLPAQNYLQNQNDKNTMLFTTFSLVPNQEWAHITNFLNFFSREDEKEYQEIERKMRIEFRDKKAEIEKLQTDPKSLIELSGEATERAISFHDKHFCWNPGEYTISIDVCTDVESADVRKKYRFTIFESHTETLLEIREHYKYGGGIWWDPAISTGVILAVVED